MKIRCQSCYRVLNNDEEWCTRCGAHSDEVEKLMKSGIEPIEEDEIGKRSVLFYFLIAFVVTGLVDVLFGVIFNNVHTGFDYGAVGQDLPVAIAYFSAINALVITGIIMAGVAFLINAKDFKDYFRFTFEKRTIISLLIGIGVVAVIVLLHKFTPISVIPYFFKDYLVNPTVDMQLEGSLSIIKILIVLLSYAFVEEVIFRKAVINWFDQTTILADGWIVVLQALIGTALSSIAILLLVNISFIDAIICISSNLVFQAILGINYFYTKRNITENLLLRLLLIILLVIIL